MYWVLNSNIWECVSCWQYNNTYKDLAYNVFTYNIDKWKITCMFFIYCFK